MTFSRLLLQNLLYHRRGNLAVCLGVVVGTAVLTGALLVGDSLRGSLRDLMLDRLGSVHVAVVPGRFFPQPHRSPTNRTYAIFLSGAASCHPDGDAKQVRRVRGVTVLAVPPQFWPDNRLPGGMDFWLSDKPGVVLNAALAQELQVKAADRITLHIQKAESVPRETLLGRRRADEVLTDLPLEVREVIPGNGLADFTLTAAPQTPLNAFVPLAFLQEKLNKKDRFNVMLLSSQYAWLRETLTLDDWGITMLGPEERARHDFRILDPRAQGEILKRPRWAGRVPDELAARAKDGVLTVQDFITYYRKHHPYLTLESEQMYIEPAVATAAAEAADRIGWRVAPTLIYLADSISDGQHEMPYAVVAALDPGQPPPLGPFLPPGVKELKDDEIILADWKESPLRAKEGDWVTVSYYDPDAHGQLERRSARFRVRGLLPLHGPADDPDLTPDFPGITDKLDIGQWENPPFPYDAKQIKPADEDYWKRYRTTPKAYVTLAKGQALWGSRFGKLTSIRLALKSAGDQPAPANKVDEFRTALLAALPPEAGGFVLQDVRKQALEGGAQATDFGGLFLGFSSFLIAAALLLIGLLFRLNLDRRASEVGLLLATGFRRATVRWLLLGEGAIVALVGSVIGCFVAVYYARFLLDFLTARWPGGLSHSFLRVYISGQSFLIGFAAASVVSLLTIFWAMRMLGRVPPTALLAGQTTLPVSAEARSKWSWSFWIMGLCVLGAISALAAGAVTRDHEAQAGSFFTSGFLLLAALLAGAWTWMRGTHHRRISGHGVRAVARLGVRNGARHPARSLLTVGLLAAATFLIIAVQAFHRDPGRDFLERKGGSGGFPLLADCDVPIYQDMNTAAGRDQLNLSDKVQQALADVEFYAFRVRQGDDASCLNLYQPRRPRLFGVPHALIERGGFHFADVAARTHNTWLLLEEPQPDGAIPVFGEATTVTWQLKSHLGGELEVQNDRGEPVKLRIVGLLQDSVFQGELLMSDQNFLKLFPRQEGFQFFLIDAPPERMSQVRDTLETALADHGFAVTSSAQRLEAFLAVENTYLLTFQALGGLGLLLGALGLAVVLLRSVWERRGELALLRALGFRRSALGWLVLAETVALLVLGLCAGTVAALVSTAPYLGESSGSQWLWAAGLLGLVLAVGLGAGIAALVVTLRAPLLPALRRE
jgi:putative ABC transport system permease protein